MGREILKKQCKIMDNKLDKILANFYLTQTTLYIDLKLFNELGIINIDNRFRYFISV